MSYTSLIYVYSDGKLGTDNAPVRDIMIGAGSLDAPFYLNFLAEAITGRCELSIPSMS